VTHSAARLQLRLQDNAALASRTPILRPNVAHAAREHSATAPSARATAAIAGRSQPQYHAGAPKNLPPQHLQPVLGQLLTGATDVAASKRLGMSPRTFSRRVSELLEYLGVSTRFQAGVASVDRGWVMATDSARPKG
jgi:DNA-binding NarL/FixJ family response regulator